MIRLAFTANQRWPQLDLKASYGLNGLGGDTGASWDEIQDGEYESWTLGVELRVPLAGGIQERNDLAAARLRKKQALLNLQAIEVDLANSLHAVIRKVSGARERADNYGIVADFNEKLLKTELSRLEAGKSDSRKVLEVEDDLLEAKIAALQSLVEYQQALIELELVSGTLLQNRGWEVMDTMFVGAAREAGETEL